MKKLKRISSRTTRVTLLEFIEDIVAEIGKEDEYQAYRSVSEQRREAYYLPERQSPYHRHVPDPLWPKKEQLLSSLTRAFLTKVEDQGWEVTSVPNDRVFLQQELEECEINYYQGSMKHHSCFHSTVHLSRKTVDFEKVMIEQFEIEAKNTNPGEYTQSQIFDNMLRRCNFANAVRDETKKRIMATANIDQLHRKPGPKPKKQ